MIKQLPSGLYFIALILFFTPWWSAGCGAHKMISLTGVQTVTGVNFDTATGFSPTMANPFAVNTETKRIPPEPLVVIACLLTIGALVIGLTMRGKRLLSAGVMGFVAGVLLLLFKARVDAKVLEEGKGAIQVVFENGFWATLFALFGAAVSQILIAKQVKPELSEAPVVTKLAPDVKPIESAPIAKRSRAELIPTEPPPSKVHKDIKYMPPGMRSELEKKTRDE